MAKEKNNILIYVIMLVVVLAGAKYLTTGTLFASLPGYTAPSTPSSLAGDVIFQNNGNRTIYFTTPVTGQHTLEFLTRQDAFGTEAASYDVFFNNAKIGSGQATTSTYEKITFTVPITTTGQQTLILSFKNDYYQAPQTNYIQSTNLLANPSFATGLNNWYGNTTQRIWNSTFSHDSIGGSFQFITFPWATTAWTGTTSDVKPVKIGDKVELSGWIYGSGVSGQQVQVGISFFNSTGYVTGANGAGTAKQWTYFAFNRTSIVNGAVHVWGTTTPKGTVIGNFDELNFRIYSLSSSGGGDRNLYASNFTLISPEDIPIQCTTVCPVGFTLSASACACIANCPTITTTAPDCTNNGSLIINAVDSNNCPRSPYCTGQPQSNSNASNSGTNNTVNSTTNTGSSSVVNNSTQTGSDQTAPTQSFVDKAVDYIKANPLVGFGFLAVLVIFVIAISNRK